MATAGAAIAAIIAISPALGGPSLKSLVKKEVSKQIGNARGPQGPPGAAATAATPPGSTLPAGVTLRGVFAPTDSHPTTGAQIFAAHGVSFTGYRLPARPAAHVIAVGGPATIACPGSAATPEAQSGHLCLYLASAPVETVTASDPVTPGNGTQYDVGTLATSTIGDGKVSTMGFRVDAYRGTSNISSASGSWAVTS